MNRDELVEKVARAIADYELPVGPGWQDRWRDYLGTADAAIDIALEEAARVAEAFPAHTHGNLATAPAQAAEQASDEIAAAIRKMKGKQDDHKT